MSAPLPFDVLFCTSEDPQHPISQLAGGAADARAGDASLTGWQSARNGKVPQTLVLRFHGNVWLQQLRILSHESKIATKVEVRVAKLADDDDRANPPSFRSVRFVKLGSVDFNSNEQSHYKSKERKTVHLKTEAYFLKLLFDRPYINALNTGQQIGIYSLECSGHVVDPVERHADAQPIVGGSSRPASIAFKPPKEGRAFSTAVTETPAVAQSSERGSSVPATPSEVADGHPLQPPGPTTQPMKLALSSNGSGPSESVLGAAFRSVRILEFEDFFLRRSEELVSLKEEAVAVEDFAVAAECRDKLALLNKRAKEVYELEQDKVQAIIDENFEVAQQVKVRMNDLVGQLFTTTALPVPAASGKSPDSAAASETSDDGASHAPAAPPAEAPPHRNPHVQPTSPLSSSSKSADNAITDNESVVSEAIEATEETQRVVDASALSSPERSVARAILSTAGSEESTSVALSSPGFDIQPLISAVGIFAAACLLSRRFKLREAALVVITERHDMFSAAPSLIEDAVLRFLDHNSFGLQDLIPNVVFAACTFIRMTLADAAGCIGSVLAPLVALLPRLLTRCSDNLQRIRDEALTTLTLYVKTPAIPANSVLSATLMEPMDKERRKLPFTNAKAQLSRLNLFQLVVEHDRLHLEGNAALSGNVLQKLLLPTVNHPNPEVRDLAVSILGKLVAARQITLRDKDLALIRNGGIRDGIASKRA
ncbi:hypothetical protein ABB37_07661 [Leptomonas pyrrhocoris]|uniref:Centrosomal protein CEP104 N-terminal domain-containing protein n=1 Tax=Leptomonas pyrrhocoris TaxID=157538 RepID=A0A0N0DT19_LEPPY|nr:hypothetical protein ABB37_07661 [Leptomonas pyrrhocoris]XP_015655307.1 hypothetical protein ABB37_07661 [Leptomonas pyrrhocoris]KPA76867.1 hypothetical protein ABB37_07661 [Leptomonas pyrrhocoris]KPA76868.1 hypothetical protein ABB37_07661 [Leptomonas pyrrhocoris]|eukprot:XP_015655306.1 hypothetical protein ABB37_07661 [Leptomonas pyrrhocoris]